MFFSETAYDYSKTKMNDIFRLIVELCNPLSSKDCSSRDRLHAICGIKYSTDTGIFCRENSNAHF